MSTELDFQNRVEPDVMQIGNVDYGTIVEYEKNYYFKMDKHRTRKNCTSVNIDHGRHKCLIYNPKHGTVRAIPGDMLVRVYNSKVTIWPCDNSDVRYHKKDPEKQC